MAKGFDVTVTFKGITVERDDVTTLKEIVKFFENADPALFGPTVRRLPVRFAMGVVRDVDVSSPLLIELRPIDDTSAVAQYAMRSSDIVQLLRENQWISAIKEIRSRLHLGLKEAKDEVDYLRDAYFRR